MNPSKQPLGLVFIHGAGLQPQIWSKVSKQLDHPFLQVAFPSMPKKQLTLEEYTIYIQQQIETWNVDKFVIVAHSIGGLLGLKLANIFPDQVVGFVAIGAAIPKRGESFLSVFPFTKRIFMNVILRIFGTRPPETAIRQGLCNDLTNDQATEIVHSFAPESIHLYTNRLKVSVPNVPKMYVKLMNDQEFTPSFQDQMIANLVPQRVEKLDSGHMPMLSSPKKLGSIINQFIKEIT